MKLKQILQLVVFPILTVFTLMSLPKTALADYLKSDGFGGNYRYELWSTDDGKYVYLKIWGEDDNPKKDRYTTSRNFESSRDALIYFDCNYAKKSLPQCPK